MGENSSFPLSLVQMVNPMAVSRNRKKQHSPGSPPAAPGAKAKSVDQLIRELRHGENEIVRSTAAAAFGYMKSEKAVGPLIDALKDSHPYVRHGAAWALGEMKATKAVDALRQALHDDDPITRTKAAEALGKIQGSSAIPV